MHCAARRATPSLKQRTTADRLLQADQRNPEQKGIFIYLTTEQMIEFEQRDSKPALKLSFSCTNSTFIFHIHVETNLSVNNPKD